MAVNTKASQEFVPIKEIRDGVVVLKDNSLRAVVMVSSVNFALKSQDERKAILYEFQNFLNALDFSVQIFIQSRRLDIRPYLILLEKIEKDQINELMKIQTREYIDFIKEFTEGTNIMSKNFFIVVPYSRAVLQIKSEGKLKSIKSIIGKKKPEEVKKGEEEAFEEGRSQLEQRIAVVEQGLARSGVRLARLGTEEIIELFYKIFNPGEIGKAIKMES
jgi:type IV secretory pathway VirB4 component